jgi:hypothetical protein
LGSIDWKKKKQMKIGKFGGKSANGEGINSLDIIERAK